MVWLKKKSDPISDRQRSLNQEIAQLEAQIKRLERGQRQNDSSSARVASAPANSTKSGEPIFELVDRDRLKSREEVASPDHYNELGVRKYDLPALWQRLRQHFRGPSTTNPKLVSYLAAGGIQGLRPMRYEKRVARNRFIALVVFLFLMMLGIILVFVRTR
jgi:hypothetical protein